MSPDDSSGHQPISIARRHHARVSGQSGARIGPSSPAAQRTRLSLHPRTRSKTNPAFSAAHRSSSRSGTSRIRPRRITRSSGCTWRSNESTEIPSAAAAWVWSASLAAPADVWSRTQWDSSGGLCARVSGEASADPAPGLRCGGRVGGRWMEAREPGPAAECGKLVWLGHRAGFRLVSLNPRANITTT